MKNTKLLLFIISILYFGTINAQSPKGTFGSKGYDLKGKKEIVMKDGKTIICEEDITDTKIGCENIDFKEVDYIRLIETTVEKFDYYNGEKFRYVPIGKGKYRLMHVVAESPELSFYTERPEMKGGLMNPGGRTSKIVEEHTVVQCYMMKEGDTEAQKIKLGYNWKNIGKLFPECTRLITYQKNKEFRDNAIRDNAEINLKVIFYIYNKGCEDVDETEVKKDIELIQKMRKEIFDTMGSVYIQRMKEK